MHLVFPVYPAGDSKLLSTEMPNLSISASTRLLSILLVVFHRTPVFPVGIWPSSTAALLGKILTGKTKRTAEHRQEEFIQGATGRYETGLASHVKIVRVFSGIQSDSQMKIPDNRLVLDNFHVCPVCPP